MVRSIIELQTLKWCDKIASIKQDCDPLNQDMIYSCKMGRSDLPDMYVQSPRAHKG